MGLVADEAATGYEAYSIMKTGRDMENRLLPFYINRFGYASMEAIYLYLTIPFIYVFDLNAWAVRLPSALLGILTILNVYCLSKELFNRKVGLIATMLAAFSPWHFMFSRFGHEGAIVPFFTTLGILFLYRSLKSPTYLFVSSITLALSLYCYPNMKVYIPLLLMTFASFHMKPLVSLVKNEKKTLLIACFMFLAIALPPFILAIQPEGMTRFNTVGIHPTEAPIRAFLSSYQKHLSVDFLLLEGDSNLRHSLPHYGLVLPFCAPFLVLGIIYIIKNRDRNGFFIIGSLLLGFIPASLTSESIPHALRSSSAMLFIEIIAAFGIFQVYAVLLNHKKYIRYGITIALASWFAVNVASLMNKYFVHYPPITELWFQYCYVEPIQFAEQHSEEYDNIVIFRDADEFWMHIFPLFYAKLDPVEFQQKRTLGKYILCDRTTDCLAIPGNNLYIVKEDELIERETLKLFYNMQGDVTYKAVQ